MPIRTPSVCRFRSMLSLGTHLVSGWEAGSTLDPESQRSRLRRVSGLEEDPKEVLLERGQLALRKSHIAAVRFDSRRRLANMDL